MKRCILIIITVFITYSFQIVKGNESVPQIVDNEPVIIIRTDKNTYFSVQLFSCFSEGGFYTKYLLVKNNGETVANINFPSSEDIKNLSVNIKRHKKGFILKCYYGGGINLYSRYFYFKSDKDSMYLYKIIGTHTTPNSDKIITEKKYLQPQIDISNFDIINYIDNTP